jgi:site-specific DNA recombinase
VLLGVPMGRVARDWNDQGFVTPQARRDGSPSPWTGQAVRALFINPRYAGLRSHVTEAKRERMDPRRARIEGVVGPAAWPGLVSEETWRAAVEILTDPSRANLPRSGRGLLTGIALCGVCGATVHRGAAPARRGKAGYPTYRCRAALGHVGRASEPVDAYVSFAAVFRMEQPDSAKLLIDDERPDAGELRREARALRLRIDALARLLADGTLSESAVRQESLKLRAKLHEVQAEQARAGRASVLGGLVGADNVQAVWDDISVDRRRNVIDALMVVTLLPAGRGTRTFRPETVLIAPKV